ncbi:MAG: Poly(3-hydroxybutyrate) depolymerase [uncultured Paraburkholderia sp.]|nr:MAG: Poly(3-hydroxybutyrate) depolymerase [uncultured Paraburkholderia sp.]CAH2937440.1 MAG: Poly(3-hydroxybutyrate) depolymerase [uncultured Paraburkholderia sp.]
MAKGLSKIWLRGLNRLLAIQTEHAQKMARRTPHDRRVRRVRRVRPPANRRPKSGRPGPAAAARARQA